MNDDFVFMMYVCEEQKKEDFIDALAQSADPNNLTIQHAIAERIGLDLNTLSRGDIEYIESEVSKRWSGYF